MLKKDAQRKRVRELRKSIELDNSNLDPFKGSLDDG